MACPHGLQCPRLKVRQGWPGGPRRCLALLLRWHWILLVSSFSECSINCLLGIGQVFISSPDASQVRTLCWWR